MVWIPGGGFRGGSAAGAIYDGAALAKRASFSCLSTTAYGSSVSWRSRSCRRNRSTTSPGTTDCSTRSRRCAG
jgi:hypothetical protein